MESNKINELIKSVEALVYYSQIYTVKGVQPVHMPDHETAWKNAQRWIWDNCTADEMGNYHLKEAQPGPRWVMALPADDAVQNWFEENIDKECSASSAIYKFRLWLGSLQREFQVKRQQAIGLGLIEDEQPAAVSQDAHEKEIMIDAVAFHDWVLENEWEINYREQRTHTTAELYKLFKQQKIKV